MPRSWLQIDLSQGRPHAQPTRPFHRQASQGDPRRRGRVRGRRRSPSPGGVADRLTSGGFADPKLGVGARRGAALNVSSDAKDPNIVLLVTAKHGTVDDAAVADAGPRRHRGARARSTSVGQVVSYWSLDNAPPLESKNGRQALVLGVHHRKRRPRQRRRQELSPQFTARRRGGAGRGRRSRRGVPPGRRHDQEGPQSRAESSRSRSRSSSW